MLTLETIAVLVGNWLTQGRIAENDFQRLKAEYMTAIKAPPGSCTTCESFRQDVLHHFRYLLKQNHISPVKSNRKYVLAEGVNSLKLPDDQRLIVNDAADNDPDLRPLTDELAETLRNRNEAYLSLIVPNLKYEPPVAKPVAPATPPARQPARSAKPAGTATPKANAAKTAPATPSATPPAPPTLPLTNAADTPPPAAPDSGDNKSQEEQPDIKKAQEQGQQVQEATGQPLSNPPGSGTTANTSTE